MMFGNGANPIFFIKINKDWMPRTLANPPPLTFNNISFMPYPQMDVIRASPLIFFQNELEHMNDVS